MNDNTPLLLEMRLFTVLPGIREEFHRISHEGTIPLMRRLGINVLAYGPASNNDNLYYLLRGFCSEQQRKDQANQLYTCPVWEREFDTPVMAMIEDYRIAVMPATRNLITELAEVPEVGVAARDETRSAQ